MSYIFTTADSLILGLWSFHFFTILWKKKYIQAWINLLCICGRGKPFIIPFNFKGKQQDHEGREKLGNFYRARSSQMFIVPSCRNVVLVAFVIIHLSAVRQNILLYFWHIYFYVLCFSQVLDILTLLDSHLLSITCSAWFITLIKQARKSPVKLKGPSPPFSRFFMSICTHLDDAKTSVILLGMRRYPELHQGSHSLRLMLGRVKVLSYTHHISFMFLSGFKGLEPT